MGVAALSSSPLIGLVFGIRAISNSGSPTRPTPRSPARPRRHTAERRRQRRTPAAPRRRPEVALTADSVRIVDPPKGERNDAGEAKLTVDDSKETGWETQRFNQSNFGNLKPGMGVLINLGTPRT